MGKVIAICISEKKGTKKDEVDSINIIEDFGLEGDAHGGNWHRQISLLGKEEIDDFNSRGGNVSYGDFGENIVTEGIDFKSMKIGDRLKVGPTLVELTQFGKECHTRCEIFHRVGDCIMPKFGVFAKVIKEGTIKSGDLIEAIL